MAPNGTPSKRPRLAGHGQHQWRQEHVEGQDADRGQRDGAGPGTHGPRDAPGHGPQRSDKGHVSHYRGV